jgi:hypothetical protein
MIRMLTRQVILAPAALPTPRNSAALPTPGHRHRDGQSGEDEGSREV